ncbi:glycosyltransferase family 2 protein [Novosphingobium mathurense]|uniref:Glycosyltransferase, GT2 family n=1 Tax=Novosphingobium mathurense TaxID=428990 RepID=A0A1U6IBR3_9SPHN|nr:glycosyltransferase family A protein [Novosphingobium mathurense]SLK05458.1 Glycosyltransferase, GT2 family [Novosphingobium mathurense]
MSRIAIEHIDASAMPPAPVRETARTLVVFWWQDVPVGQVIDEGRPGEPIDLQRHWQAFTSSPALARAREVVGDHRRPTLDASVVICTRDRPDVLRECLASLVHQTYRPAEVIVVDNASVDDRTRHVAEEAGVVYVREDRPGLDIARNSGARRARSKVIAYTDDDVRLHPRWLERLTLALEAGDAMAVTGLVLPAELETEAQILFETHWSFGQGYMPRRFDESFFAVDRHTGSEVWKIGAGASMAFHRRAFEIAGYFDERLDVGAAGCSGDSEYWHRVLSHGGVCVYDPAAVAFHVHRREIAGLASQIYHYMRGHAAALMVQHERTGNRGNLRRAFAIMPRYYAGRALHRVVRGQRPDNRFLRQEISGYVAGLIYYWRHRKAPQP